MSGRIIEITSGQEDLTSKGINDILDASLEDLSDDVKEALLSLAGVNSLGQEELSVSLEDLQISENKIKAEGEKGCCCEHRPPLCSKVIGADGSAKITILYDGSQVTGGDSISMFRAMIDSAVESDVVDITIMTCFNNFARAANDTVRILSLLNSIKNCKAKRIITRAGLLGTIGDCALWLSGTERHVGPMMWLMVKPYRMITEGSMRDIDERSDVMRANIELLGSICTDAGLLTEDEVKRLYDDECSVSLSYEDLTSRIDALKH